MEKSVQIIWVSLHFFQMSSMCLSDTPSQKENREARLPASVPGFLPQYHTDKADEGGLVGTPLLPLSKSFEGVGLVR